MSEGILTIARQAHHSPKSICVACTLNTLNELYYLLFDTQIDLAESRPSQEYVEFGKKENSIAVLDSSCAQSMHYLITRLQDSTSFEFEAYVSVGRNLIEKISRLLDVLNDPDKKEQASNDFEKTYDDVTHIFEATNPKNTAKQMKTAKWLGRGTDRKNINGEKYDLLYAYLSRTIHVSNMDTLLQPKEDRFFIKAYILMSVAWLYHNYCQNIPYISKNGKELHNKCAESLKQVWHNNGSSPEVLIYCTTYYDKSRGNIERAALDEYKKLLDNAFQIYKRQEGNVLPKFEIK